MRKTLLKSLALTAIGALCMAGSAMATPLLDGGLSMTGTWTPIDQNGVQTSFTNATGIDFGGWWSGALDNTFFVTSATEDFVSLAGQIGTINNFQFEPENASTPVSPLWTVAGYSFQMTSLSVTTHNNAQLAIFGTGKMSASGYLDTPGTWNFTSQGANSLNFSWSASSEAVPEPTTMLLFGTGLVGLAGIARRRRNEK